jgi:hypothetical protein
LFGRFASTAAATRAAVISTGILIVAAGGIESG